MSQNGYHFGDPEIGINIGFRISLDEGKAEKYGETVQQFLTEHSDGELNSKTVIRHCETCGALRMEPKLDMYLPSEEYLQKLQQPADERENEVREFLGLATFISAN